MKALYKHQRAVQTQGGTGLSLQAALPLKGVLFFEANTSFFPPPGPHLPALCNWTQKQPLPIVWESLRPIRSLFSSFKIFSFPSGVDALLKPLKSFQKPLPQEKVPWRGTTGFPMAHPALLQGLLASSAAIQHECLWRKGPSHFHDKDHRVHWRFLWAWMNWGGEGEERKLHKMLRPLCRDLQNGHWGRRGC